MGSKGKKEEMWSFKILSKIFGLVFIQNFVCQSAYDDFLMSTNVPLQRALLIKVIFLCLVLNQWVQAEQYTKATVYTLNTNANSAQLQQIIIA